MTRFAQLSTFNFHVQTRRTVRAFYIACRPRGVAVMPSFLLRLPLM
jgi:hypothetical protein